MTPRERILATLNFQGPDRCPINHYLFPGAFRRHGQALLDVLARYPDDSGNKSTEVNRQKAQEEGESGPEIIEWQDKWGITWRRMRGYTCGEVLHPAIPDWDAWPGYEFPPQQPDSHFEEFAAHAREMKAAGEFVGAGTAGFFQHMQELRGPAEYLLDLAEDRAEVHELADRMVEYNLYSIERYVKAGADCISFDDDWGSQERLLVHPDMWRSFFKARYRRMFEVAREAGVHVAFHSDGWTLDIIDDLIEIGVTLLNPQHACMGTKRVGEIVAGRIAIRTDIDRQWVIPHGSPQEITDAVKEAIEAFGRNNGGCLLSGEIGPDVPLGNIEALYSAFYEYGKYPLTWLEG